MCIKSLVCKKVSFPGGTHAVSHKDMEISVTALSSD